MRELRLEEANIIISERKKVSDGKWFSHSECVAKAAYAIANHMGMNAEKAYVMGLMHDIGRSFTDGQFQHIKAGYEYMSECGYIEIARICLTHSFPVQDIYTYVGKIDIPEEEQIKYQDMLKREKYNSYDRLIQLCDSVSVENGYVIPEKKFVINAFKYGINDSTMKKWKAVLDLYEYFGKKIEMEVILFLEQQILGKIEI